MKPGARCIPLLPTSLKRVAVGGPWGTTLGLPVWRDHTAWSVVWRQERQRAPCRLSLCAPGRALSLTPERPVTEDRPPDVGDWVWRRTIRFHDSQSHLPQTQTLHMLPHVLYPSSMVYARHARCTLAARWITLLVTLQTCSCTFSSHNSQDRTRSHRTSRIRVTRQPS